MHDGPQPVAAEELEAFERAIRHAFHEDGHPDDVAHSIRTLEPGRTLAIRHGGEIVAGAAVLTRTMTVPGGAAVPVAGVSAVGVRPGHTRRGHLGRLMRRQLADVHEAGREAIAALWASEGAIYGRYGYGLASRSVTYQLQCRRAALRRDLALPAEQPRVLPASVARPIAAVYEAARSQAPGMFARDKAWWEHRLYDPEHRRDGLSPLQAVVQPGPDGEPAGYALFAAKVAWSNLGAGGEAQVRELVATTPEARAGLWAFLLSLDLIEKLRWRLAPDHDPLPHMLASTDPLTHSIGHGLWVRVVDADRALAARSYSAPLDLVLELDDADCPWNAGRHRLASDGETATCEPTTAPADLALGAEALGAAYLGGTRLESLAGAGRVRELRPGALRRAALAFRGLAEPWCPEIF